MGAKQKTGQAILGQMMGDFAMQKRSEGTNNFNQDIRRLSEEYCFGEIWARPGLERKTRSMLCIAMLIGGNRLSELRDHFNGALNHGCTSDEIKEILLQAAVYCGLPAGVEATRIAEDVIKDRAQIA